MALTKSEEVVVMPVKEAKKRRQHHVFRSFLGAWSPSGRIHCLSDGKIFASHTRNVAVEGDFYQLEEITAGDREFILAMIKPTNSRGHRTSINFLEMFTAPYTARNLLIERGLLTPEINAQIELAIQNTEENYHGAIENKATGILAQLREGNIHILEDDRQHLAFSYFIALQYFRTKAMRESMRAGVDSGPTFDFNRCWKILAHIYAGNVGGTIYIERKRQPVTLIKNDTSIPFITGDQPVFNLHGGSLGLGKKFLSLYYPVSPRYAVFIDDAGHPLEIDKHPLDETIVTRLNDEMAAHSHAQIFADSAVALQRYLNKP
jgi:hypothetical protein